MGGRFGGGFGALALAAGPHHAGRTRYPAGYRPQKGYYFKPHNGAQEMARRVRQAERVRENRLARAVARRDKGHPCPPGVGLSRRGLYVRLDA